MAEWGTDMAEETLAPNRRHVTIADIARAAGVSKSTVSYALNGKPGVGEEMRRQIVDLATSLGFHQSSAARALSNARASAIGLVTHGGPATLGTLSYFMDFLTGIEQELGTRDQALVIRTVTDVDGELEVYAHWAKDRRVDGVIVRDQLVDDPRPAALARFGLPAVIAGQRSSEGLPAVRADDQEAAAIAVRHLAGLGHRRIARVPGPPRHLHTEIRGRAFAAAMAAEELAAPGDHGLPADVAAATRQLLRRAPRPTAIVYESVGLAVDGLRVAAELGLDVPRELSIVAWDDSPICELLSPPLTALHRDVLSFGAACARRVLALLDGVEVTVEDDRPVLLTQLRVRGSTAPPPAR